MINFIKEFANKIYNQKEVSQEEEKRIFIEKIYNDENKKYHIHRQKIAKDKQNHVIVRVINVENTSTCSELHNFAKRFNTDLSLPAFQYYEYNKESNTGNLYKRCGMIISTFGI
jgi:hypothetical protein